MSQQNSTDKIRLARTPSFKGCLLSVPAMTWLILFFLAPLIIVIVVSFWERGPRGTVIHEWTKENYEYVDETYRPILDRSIEMAGTTTLLCLVIGYPLAFFISTRKKQWVKQLSLFLVILPFWTNFLIRTYAWQVLLGNNGIFNHYMVEWGFLDEPWEILYTRKAVIIGMVYGFLPFMILPIYGTLERFDFRMIEAAHDLGGNKWSAFRRILLPMTFPGVIAGIILVFVPAIGAFVTPDLLGGVQGLMIGNLINNAFRRRNMPRGSATSIVLMGIVALGMLVYMLVERSTAEGPSSVERDISADRSLWSKIITPIMNVYNTITSLPGILLDETKALIAENFPLGDEIKMIRDTAIEWAGKIILWAAPVVNYVFLWIPITILILFSFNDSRSTGVWRGFSTRWYVQITDSVARSKEDFSTELMLETLQNSMIVSISSTLIATALGTLLAMSLVRGKYPGKNLISGFLFLPVAIPEIAQAFSLYIFFNLAFDYLGESELALGIVDTINYIFGTHYEFGFGYMTIIVAHVAFNISFVAIVVRARLVDMNPRFEEAARDLGANEWHTFWRVTFPLLFPGILAGALLAFTLSLDDFVITLMTTGVGTTTLTVYVYGLLKQTVTPEINAVSTLMIVASTLLVGISLVLQGRNASEA